MVFATIAAVFLLISLLWLLLFALRVISVDPHIRHIPILVLLAESLLIGGSIALFVGKLIIRPVQHIIEAFDKLSKGNFDVRVPTNEKITEIREMAERFNSMAHDLSHMETLRNDFAVNVSHEFKTPISAIEGYAPLLQDPNLTLEKHGHNVDKILDNSQRLSSLSGNILALPNWKTRKAMAWDLPW